MTLENTPTVRSLAHPQCRLATMNRVMPVADYILPSAFECLVKIPRQERSRQTFNRIVTASIDILVKSGIAELNTNRISREAGVNIATVYTYFSSKDAIIYYLSKFYEDDRAALVRETLADISEYSGLFEELDSVIDRLVEYRLNNPGCVVVRNAVAGMPEAPDYDAQSTETSANTFSNSFIASVPGICPENSLAVGRFYSQLVTMVLDHAFTETPYKVEHIESLKEITRSWLPVKLRPETPDPQAS